MNPIKRNMSLPKDLIENKYTEREIRLYYAKLKAGKGKHTPLEDIPTYLIKEALKEDYEVVIQGLAIHWRDFCRHSTVAVAA